MSDPAIACRLRPGDLNRRAAELLPGLAARARRRELIAAGPDGTQAFLAPMLEPA